MQATNQIDTIIDNLISLHPLLSKNFTKSIREKSNLNPGTIFIAGLLRKFEYLSMTEIGNKLSMPKPHVTAQVDKLIAEDMVERIYDSKDRRIINIRLTEKGRKDFEIIKEAITENLRKHINTLSPETVSILFESTKNVREILAEMVFDSTDDNCCQKK